MSVDLEAERAASAERREERDFELWLRHRAGMLRTEGDVSLEAARKLWPSKDDDYLRQVVARAERDIQRGRQTLSDVWDGADMVKRGAELFGDFPDATARDIYGMLMKEANGRTPGVTEGSWVGGYATRARRLAEAGGPVTTAEPEPEGVDRGRIPESAVTQHEAPTPPDETAPDGEAGDRIRLDIAGRHFGATRSGEEWDVVFAGTVDEEAMRAIMGRVMEAMA